MQTYLITGANRGIGLEITRQLLGLGERVIATCRNPGKAADLSALSGSLDVHELDVTDHEETVALSRKLDGTTIDVLINNAGYMAEQQSVDDMSFSQWMDSFAVNAVAPWRISTEFVSQVALSKHPRIVTLTSQMASLERAASDRVAYRSSKAAANMAMRTLAMEWESRGIVVCMLHPGWVRTDMGGNSASLGTEESATGLVSVIDGLSMKDNGHFLDHNGHTLPW